MRSKLRESCCVIRLVFLLVIGAIVVEVAADERRARPPKFNPGQLQGIFFEDLEQAFPGERPSIASIRASAQAKAVMAARGNSAGSANAQAAVDDPWSDLISPVSIEDEVKRVRLHFDSVVTVPAAFNSGGYQDARLDLTILATLFAVISEHGGEVRWKDQAAAARDLVARTAFNCKAGSTQVYNEAKLRKADLQDLVSGSGISAREAPEANDWSSIADRSPLMEYLEQLIDSLEDATRNEASVRKQPDLIQRNSELVAMLGEVLVQEGMDEADDEDYASLSRSMTEAAKGVTVGLERMDVDAIRQGASAIRQRCDACHEQYR